MRIFLLEPYHTGSHAAWAEGWAARSRHEIHLLTLPGRFWKWRVHGSSVTLAEQTERLVAEAGRPDAIVASGMSDLATYLGLTRRIIGDPRTLLYLHENQLTYPESPRTRGVDLSYAFINWRSMVAADAIRFNSRHHADEFFAAVGGFLRNFPDERHTHLIDDVAAKSAVLPVGVDLDRFPQARRREHPLILWNQRWEYDKDPVTMFDGLFAAADAGLDFEVAICGENFRQEPAEFEAARRRLGDRVVHMGFADEDTYVQLVADASITVSTALHEFFGVAVVEAMSTATFPVLPKRLSYPELLPREVHEVCLYDDPAGYVDRLAWALRHRTETAAIAQSVAKAVRRFDWSMMIDEYDRTIEDLT